LQDRFTRGYLSGAAAGVVMAALNIAFFNLGWSKDRYLDMVAMLFWSDMPKSLWEMGFAQVIHIAVDGLLGIVFAYLLPKLESGYLLLKGSTFGAATWFIIHAAGAFFHVPVLSESNSLTILMHLIASTIYGLLLVVILTWFESRVDSKERTGEFGRAAPSPAFKLVRRYYKE